MFYDSFLHFQILNFLLYTITIFDYHSIIFNFKNGVLAFTIDVLFSNYEEICVRFHVILDLLILEGF